MKIIYQVKKHWVAAYQKGDHGVFRCRLKKSFRRLLARVEGYFKATGNTFMSSMFHIKLATLGQDLYITADKVLEQVKQGTL